MMSLSDMLIASREELRAHLMVIGLPLKLFDSQGFGGLSTSDLYLFEKGGISIYFILFRVEIGSHIAQAALELTM